GGRRRPAHQPFRRHRGVEVDVEPRQQLPVLVLRADDLHVVAEGLAQQEQGVVGAGLGRGDHLTEPEQLLYQRTRGRVDLVSEVGEGGATGQPHRLAVPARRARAHGERGEVVELLPPLLPRLAPTRRPATRTAERARRTAAAAAATATPGGTAPVATGRAHARAAGTTTETTAGPRTAATAATTGRRTARGATPTRDAGRPGRPLARHGRGRRPGRHRGRRRPGRHRRRRRPGRHRRRRRPGAGRGDAVRVVDTATHRRARGLPAVGRRLLPALGLPGGLHRRLLLSLERGGPGL